MGQLVKKAVPFLNDNRVMEDVLNLIKRIRNKEDEDEAFACLLEQFRPMIFKIIYSNDLNKGDFRVDENDLFQEGSLALYKAVFSFEEDRNVRFSSYVYMVIRSRIREALRSSNRVYGDEPYSLDGNVDYSLKFCVKEDPAQYHREQCFKEELNAFMSSLDPDDRTLFELKRQDLSYKEISERMHINIKRVDNRLMTLRRRLKRYLRGIKIVMI